ncbi:single-stranded DNA-binding protein [Brachybacterium saurashtrense]|uniref:Single-stranded DNA-binding protein n=1 Tax=Brachybacterium saurashtrense TaxID=556288 RepID=A0A345YLP3_9MICO|nr:single-stranded DNA-binding protein [Brachybacterium saurashtrense]AXK44845.1 single-stranded DNA-binding protein [Brachybacterium saurashtrense]RRR20821.1 single-stranded DNA-binding protein [Brachybacterium saurashtrense]
MSGFIATDPQLTYTERGEARFYARFGQENYRREENGEFTKLEPSFGNLVLYRATAERAYERFTKGDQFVAEGYTHDYSYEREGQQIEGEEFVAKKIGHDTARTRYDVDRTPRHQAQTVERDSPAREQNGEQNREQVRPFDPPQQPQQARQTAAAPVLGQ